MLSKSLLQRQIRACERNKGRVLPHEIMSSLRGYAADYAASPTRNDQDSDREQLEVFTLEAAIARLANPHRPESQESFSTSVLEQVRAMPNSSLKIALLDMVEELRELRFQVRELQKGLAA